MSVFGYRVKGPIIDLKELMIDCLVEIRQGVPGKKFKTKILLDHFSRFHSSLKTISKSKTTLTKPF